MSIGNALILSPFATYPLDAGQRKRAYQTTLLLKDWGFEITFLHFAFEQRWYWGHNHEDDQVLQSQWGGNVTHFYANNRVGLPPNNGSDHQLDEWWDPALGGYLENIFSKRRYDIFVVHNIWLSKAFDHASDSCFKILDMHDIFSARASEFIATNATPEFFHCSQHDECFGLNRADLLFAIKEEDAEWCANFPLNSTKVITLPYAEKLNNKSSLKHPSKKIKLNQGKVVFGMIGSDIHFNRYALTDLISKLEQIITKTYAPIEFVIAGSVCKSISSCPAFVKKLGFVSHVSDFYETVDIVIVPMMHGTGVKIKSVEAIAYQKPILFTKHSAEGTGYLGKVYQSIDEIAEYAAQIAIFDDIPEDLFYSTSQAVINIDKAIDCARIEFEIFYKQKRPSFVQLIASNSLSKEHHLIQAGFGMLLQKQLSSWFRSHGIALQPELAQYVQSVPGQNIPIFSDLDQLLLACSKSQFCVVSPGQHELIELIFDYYAQIKLLVDMRLCELSFIVSELSYLKFFEGKIVIIISPQQRFRLDLSWDGIGILVLPLLDELLAWDPHLGILRSEINNVYDSLGEITRQALADDAISLGLSCLNENIMSQPVAYNARMAINEAKLQISDLMRVSQ
jgi:hypothetical protein